MAPRWACGLILEAIQELNSEVVALGNVCVVIKLKRQKGRTNIYTIDDVDSKLGFGSVRIGQAG
jgi:hypothetical protein